MTPEDHAEIDAFEALPLDAQVLFGLWFGLGSPETFTLRHGLKEWKPTPRTIAALQALLEHGFIYVEQEPCGARVYRMHKSARAAWAWMSHHMENSPAFMTHVADWRLMEPV